MNKKLYYKTFIYITLFYFVLLLLTIGIQQLLFVDFNISFIFFGLLISYLLVIILFTISFCIYNPIFQKAKKESKLNKILFDLIQKSVLVTNSEDLYQLILDSAILSLPKAQKGCILLLNQETNILQFVAAKGYDFNILKQTFLKLDQTYLYRESKGKIERTVFIDDPFGYDRLNLHDSNIDEILEAGSDAVFSTLSTPVILGDTLYGMINIDSNIRHAYDKDDEHIIELFALEVINVIKLYQSLEKVNYFMQNDILTNTYNRNYFNNYLEKQLVISKENNLTFALVSIDLNDLKKANDTYGHECGDLLLSEFSFGIKKNIASPHCFARYGGDEFQLLLPEYTFQQADELIHKVMTYFSCHPIIFNHNNIEISFCYGIVCYPEDETTFNGLIIKGDKRMYIQKKHYHLNQKN